MTSRLTDYWDTRINAIDTNAAKLGGLADGERQVYLGELAASVRERLDALGDADALLAAFIVAEDLYKTIGQRPNAPDESVYDYLESTAAILMRGFESRGIYIRYIIDNDFPTLLTGPLVLYPQWFNAAGLFYICPQQAALAVMEETPGFDPGTAVTRIDEFLEDGWAIAYDLAERCERDGRPYVFLNAIPSGCLDGFLNDRVEAAEGSSALPVLVFRNEAPKTGSRATAIFPERYRGQIAEKFKGH